MSIYATWLSIDDENHTLRCARWQRCKKAEIPERGGYAVATGERYYRPVPDAPCTCREKAPLIYQGSHVNPSDDDPRGGSVMVSAIPNHCHPDARFNDADAAPVDFLRLSVMQDPATYRHDTATGDATVVLDKRQVRELARTLRSWLKAGDRA